MLYSKKIANPAGVKKLYAFTSIFLSIVLISGCGVWTDFTTYFNTYYNAKNLFDQTEEQILLQRKDIFLFRDLTQQINPSVQYNINYNNQGLQQNQLGQDNIQNQYNQNQYNQNQTNQPTQYNQPNQNQYGQQTNSQFAQPNTGNISENLRRVIEKCSKILQYDRNSSYFADALFIIGKALYYQREYVGAQRKFIELAGLNSKKYGLENKLWLAKTYLQLRGFDEGLKLIDEVKEESLKEENERIYTDAAVVLIGFLSFRQDYLQAAAECKNYLSTSKNDETKALVSFQLGKIYTQLSDEKSAIDAYSSVLKYAPTFEIEYRSRLETAKLLKQLNKINESEALLENMRYQGRYKLNLYEILLELAQLYYDKNDITKAVNISRDVDSTYKMYEAGGLASDMLGKIYKNKIKDYDSSYKYYSKVVMSLAPPEKKTEAAKQIKNLDKYFELKGNLKSSFKKIDYASNPNNFIRDSIDYAIAYRELADENKRAYEASGLANQAPQQQQPQFALPVYTLLQQQAALYDLRKKREPLTNTFLVKIGIIKKPEMPKISRDSLAQIIGKNLYDIGNHFFTELEVPDSAEYYMKQSLYDYPNKSIKVQSMFTLGTIYETVNDSVNAKKIYRYIYDSCAANPLAKIAAEKLGLVKSSGSSSTIKPGVSEIENLALKQYEIAEKDYYDKKYTAAIDSFLNVYRNFSTTTYAPKSLYYVGMIYESELKNYDSAAVYYGMLVNEYKKFPLYARLNDKLNEYKKAYPEKIKAVIKKDDDDKPVNKETDTTKINALQDKQQGGSENKTGTQAPLPRQPHSVPDKPARDSTAAKKIEY